MAFHEQSVILSLLATSDLQQLISNFFLPFIFVFAILWGLLSLIPLFNRRINFVLALVIAILFANSPYFVTLTAFLSQIIGGTVVLIFFALFAVGALVYAISRGSAWKQEFEPYENRLKKLNKQIAKLNEKLEEARSEEEKDQILETIEQLEKQRERLIRKYHS
jgi:predicted PurR-regulated permease PerM